MLEANFPAYFQKDNIYGEIRLIQDNNLQGRTNT